MRGCCSLRGRVEAVFTRLICTALLSATLVVALPLTGRAEPGAWLGDLTWKEAEARLADTPVVIIPFAAGAKEHGLHLPLRTDQAVMEYLCEAAVEALPVLVAPPVLHGWFPSFRDYPGTEVANPEVFQAYLRAIAQSLARNGARRIVFLNMGIAKATGLPISIVARDLRVDDGVATLVINWDDLETDAVGEFTEQEQGGHADEIETSIMLFLAPDSVDMAAAQTDYGDRPPKDYAGYRPGLFARDEDDPNFSETGGYGDPALATADKGRRTLEIMRAEWLRALRGFADTPIPPARGASRR